MMEIDPCVTDSDFSEAIRITRDYIRWINLDLSFQNVDEEIAKFSSMYAPPGGLFLLARLQGKPVGGTGFRMFEGSVCEMKRLFVYEHFRGCGAGRMLCERLIREASRAGYRKMRLDTLGRMKEAVKLYQKLRFKKIEPYRFNPDPAAIYMELSLV